MENQHQEHMVYDLSADFRLSYFVASKFCLGNVAFEVRQSVLNVSILAQKEEMLAN